MQTSLKICFAQIFSCRPKNLSSPNFGRAAPPPVSPAYMPMRIRMSNKNDSETGQWQTQSTNQVSNIYDPRSYERNRPISIF